MEHPVIISSRGKVATRVSFRPRRNLDYQGIARRRITVPPQPITYDRDIDISACIKAERVKFPLFEIFSNPTISLTEPKKFDHDIVVVNSSGKIGNSNSPGIGRRRFSVIDRAVQKARQDIMNQEDDAIFAALDAASGNKDI